MQKEKINSAFQAEKIMAKLRNIHFVMVFISILSIFTLSVMVVGAIRLSVIATESGAGAVGMLLIIYSSTLLFLALASLSALFAFYWKYNRSAVSLMEGMLNLDSGPLAVDESSPWHPWALAIDTNRAATAQNIAALEEQGDLRNAILASAIGGIVTSNDNGVITEFNPAAEAMFGWSHDEIIGRQMEETIVPPAFQARHKDGMTRYINGGKAHVIGRNVEMQGMRRDGSIFPMELAIAEATVGGSRIFIGYIRDLTEQHRTQSELSSTRESLHQSEKLTALGSLLAGVAHELNNPLAIVVGRAAILEEKLTGTPHLAPIQKLRAAADRCSRIVKTFLAMARQSGPRRGIVQLNALIEGAVDMAAYGLRTDGVDVRQELAADLPTTSADEDQLVQVLINLIVNAQHAMAGKAGEHRLTIRTRHDPGAGSVIVEVEDSGFGIPEEIATRIFDPFFTTKDVGAGTGMGLSVSRGMIEAHGGTLTLAQNSAKGAMFRVTLPIRRDSGPQETTIAAEAVPQIQGRILIVDDEPELVALLVDCFTPLGVACDVASDGQAALNKIAKTPYAAIITDVRMPGMDGIALYERLQAEDPALAARLAFVSGDVLHNDAARVAAMGDRPLIEKPFDPEHVRDVALRLLATGGSA